jgi:hypothetical protein
LKWEGIPIEVWMNLSKICYNSVIEELIKYTKFITVNDVLKERGMVNE